MNLNYPLTFSISTEKYVLSSLTRAFKTERFIHDVRRFGDADAFLARIGDAIALNTDFCKSMARADVGENANANDFSFDCFKVNAVGLDFTLFFKSGAQTGGAFDTRPTDIVFFKCEFSNSDAKRNDTRLSAYLRSHSQFDVTLQCEKDFAPKEDFLKLYTLSGADGVNFPLLNKQQRALVETEDKNVLVQGVAGSGKTNICIDKIVYSACRNYRGRILYSTYSRGLLLDTRNKINAFSASLRLFCEKFKNGRAVFADDNHKKAVEDKLGVYFDVDGDDKLAASAEKLADILENNVDYFMPEDLYKKYVDANAKSVGEAYFLKNYVKNISNHQLRSRLNKVKRLSFEVVYKEIHGLILGSYDPQAPAEALSLEQYKSLRKESFGAQECETIYAIAKDYAAQLEKSGLVDDNAVSRRLLKAGGKIERYSLAVLDEVQDMTEVTLCFFKSVTLKLFCVGDALQMINPSYFSFAYLKRLMYERDVVSVAQLANNYRNTEKIATLIDGLAELSEKQFGTHNFVVKAKSVESDVPTSAVYVRDAQFASELAKRSFENFTLIVSDNVKKENLRKLFKSQEILTVSESKGLERDTVVLLDVLSDHADKWRTLARISLNRKQADENSVYRYYYNLFYVGVSRAKANIYVAESEEINSFNDFFDKNFDVANRERAIEGLDGIVSRAAIDQDEIVRRVREFVRLGQFDNARFAASNIEDGIERELESNKIEVNEKIISGGDYRSAGIRYWELGMFDDAKEQFLTSGDDILVKFVDASAKNDSGGLDISILDYFEEFAQNPTAMKLVTDTVNRDLENLKNRQKAINGAFRPVKERKNG